MPKLSLKETKAERDEKEWRRMRKAARKASRYLVDEQQAESSRRKHRRPTPPPPDDEGLMDSASNYGWTPPPSSTKHDPDAEWQAKLFDAMDMDDSGQDSAQAWFNSYVPPRWRHSSEDPIAGPPTLASLGHEEYAEYMRRGMWERTHKAEFEEQERRKAQAEERRRREKEMKAKSKEMEKEETERRRRRRDEKTQRAFVDGWKTYQSRWSDLQKQASSSTPPGDDVDFGNLPWPVYPAPTHPEALTKDAISSFLLSDRHSGDKNRKQRLREAFLLYHPDRFEGKFMPLVRAKDRTLVKDAAGRVVRALNALAEEDR